MLNSVKNILVAVTSEASDERDQAALSYGLWLASAAGAHLTVQAASAMVMLPFGYVTEVVAEIISEENQDLLTLTKAVSARARRDADLAGVVCATQAEVLPAFELEMRLAAQARVHDLTVADAQPDASASGRGAIEALLTRSGRPVIIVPAGASSFQAGRILVAWDGSAQAARAVNDALPFLAAAEAVEIVTVTGEKDLANAVPGADLARHLSRHGIATEARTVAMAGDVAETLRERATLFRADLLVMGGFVHSRLREWVFGGVTQSLLDQSPVPIFLSH